MDQAQRSTLTEAPLLRLVALAGHVTGRRWSALMSQQHGMTAAGVNALLMIAWGTGRGLTSGTPGRATNVDLSRRLWIRPATLTGVIDTLVKAGYVVRERDKTDRRVVWLVLTESGRIRASEIGKKLKATFRSPATQPDPVQEAIIRDFLIGLIMAYQEKEPGDE